VNKTSPKLILPRLSLTRQIAVIGGGAIGSATAWQLASHGHEVDLIDPLLDEPINRSGTLNGTTASLGILMGHVFRKASGRGWRLRRRSMELWQEWLVMLNSAENPLKLETPLVQLASSEKEASLMKKLSKDRKALGLELLHPNTTIQNDRVWPENSYGGLISHQDGRLNPLQLQKCLLNTLDTYSVQKLPSEVIHLERGLTTNKQPWLLHLSNGKTLAKEIIIICAALGSEALLKPLGHNIPLTPVLGQVLNLKLPTNNENWSGWPAVLNSEGVNLIPNGRNHMLMGATLEPGICPKTKTLEQMKRMNGNAPNWLQKAKVIEQWSGLRGRPTERPSPVLKKLETGLIVATGHYRNGILLAPASAEWVVEEVAKEE